MCALTVFADPGFVPLTAPDHTASSQLATRPEVDVFRLDKMLALFSTVAVVPRKVTVNGLEHTEEYCRICHIYRPPVALQLCIRFLIVGCTAVSALLHVSPLCAAL